MFTVGLERGDGTGAGAGAAAVAAAGLPSTSSEIEKASVKWLISRTVCRTFLSLVLLGVSSDRSLLSLFLILLLSLLLSLFEGFVATDEVGAVVAEVPVLLLRLRVADVLVLVSVVGDDDVGTLFFFSLQLLLVVATTIFSSLVVPVLVLALIVVDKDAADIEVVAERSCPSWCCSCS